ncbi:MAG: ATP-grasp domain-containing protein [Dehalococcoidales bacterium]|nr:ATP-grasp domain-containing protein [Dehalococcoidales bacterium]
MNIGLACDLKDAVPAENNLVTDALEEYDSVETVEIIKASLENGGHQVTMLGGGKQFLDGMTAGSNIDIVFNIAEGRGTYRSREAQVPSVLEMLDIPYTGSDPLTLAVCLDKPLTKKLVKLEGVRTPDWVLVTGTDTIDKIPWTVLKYPSIVKPAFEGSSKGVHATALVHDGEEARKEVCSQLRDYRQPVLCEEFIDGDEVTVGIIGNKNPDIVGMMRVLPRKATKHFVYSLEVKRDWQVLVDYECPAELGQKTLECLREDSLKAYHTLGCRDFSRVDFRIDAQGTPYFIEINPLPGLGTYSDLIIMALKLGWTHENVIRSVFNAALERYPRLACA